MFDSIQLHGQVKPLVLSAAGSPFDNEVLCCGHTTLIAMQNLAMEECDVVVKEFDSESQFIDYAIRDNKTSEFADWDKQLLADLNSGFDIDLKGMGFDIKIDANYGEDEIVFISLPVKVQKADKAVVKELLRETLEKSDFKYEI